MPFTHQSNRYLNRDLVQPLAPTLGRFGQLWPKLRYDRDWVRPNFTLELDAPLLPDVLLPSSASARNTPSTLLSTKLTSIQTTHSDEWKIRTNYGSSPGPSLAAIDSFPPGHVELSSFMEVTWARRLQVYATFPSSPFLGRTQAPRTLHDSHTPTPAPHSHDPTLQSMA